MSLGLPLSLSKEIIAKIHVFLDFQCRVPSSQSWQFKKPPVEWWKFVRSLPNTQFHLHFIKTEPTSNYVWGKNIRANYLKNNVSDTCTDLIPSATTETNKDRFCRETFQVSCSVDTPLGLLFFFLFNKKLMSFGWSLWKE